MRYAWLMLLAGCCCHSRDAEVESIVLAERTLVDGGPDGLRIAIQARIDNLVEGHTPGYRARDPLGGWDMRVGTLERTDRDLDLAIDGEGFFRVIAADSTVRITRFGHFELDAEGSVILGGLMLDPPVTVPENVIRVFIDTTGLVQGLDATNPSNLQVIGQLQLTRFINPGRLVSDDGILFQETPQSGVRIDGEPGQGGFGMVRQGFLEESNVDRLRELRSLAREVRQCEIAQRFMRR